MTTNKNGANKATVLAALHHLRGALKNQPQTAAVDAALAQCDRLEVAINQFHAEGLRFAAFTLLRIVQSSGTAFTGPVQKATLQLKAALDAAGYPH
jgi:hypothetical protein